MANNVKTVWFFSDLEHIILVAAPEAKSFEWIQRRASEIGEPDDGPFKIVDDADLTEALAHLMNLGMLTYESGRWRMTSKGYAAI